MRIARFYILILSLSFLNLAFSQQNCTDVFRAASSKVSETGNVTVTHGKKKVSFYRTTRSILTMKQDGDYIFYDFINNVIDNKLPLLDAGTSEGKMVFDLIQRGVKAIGVDIALLPNLVQNPSFVQSDIRKMDMFKDGEFKAVLCSFNVFTYNMGVEFRREAMTELLRVLEPGGEILLVGVTGLQEKGNFGSLKHKDIDAYVELLNKQFEDQLYVVASMNLGEGKVIRFKKL